MSDPTDFRNLNLAVSQLRAERNDLIVADRLRGMTCGQIGQRYGLTPHAVHSVLKRADSPRKLTGGGWRQLGLGGPGAV